MKINKPIKLTIIPLIISLPYFYYLFLMFYNLYKIDKIGFQFGEFHQEGFMQKYTDLSIIILNSREIVLKFAPYILLLWILFIFIIIYLTIKNKKRD